MSRRPGSLWLRSWWALLPQDPSQHSWPCGLSLCLLQEATPMPGTEPVANRMRLLLTAV